MLVTTPSTERLAELRGMPYAKYLLTPEWRVTRDRALRRARFRCERCHSRGELQVHHRTYTRLGVELPEDLEVLCDRDHRRQHLEDLEVSPSGIYLKLARQVLRDHPFFTLGDICDATKWLCAKHKIAYDGPGIHKAIGLLTGARVVPVTFSVWPPNSTIESIAVTAEAAHEILTGLGIATGNVIRQLPDGFLPHEESVLEQASGLRATARRSRTFEQRIEEIFDRSAQAEQLRESARLIRERQEIKQWVLRRYDLGINDGNA